MLTHEQVAARRARKAAWQKNHIASLPESEREIIREKARIAGRAKNAAMSAEKRKERSAKARLARDNESTDEREKRLEAGRIRRRNMSDAQRARAAELARRCLTPQKQAKYIKMSADRNKLRAETDHVYNMHRRVRSTIRGALIRCGIKKGMRSQEYLGCSVDAFCKYIESLFCDGMNWGNRSKWNIDHIVPVAMFYELKEAGFTVCHHYTNLRPMWASENWLKHDNLTHADWALSFNRSPIAHREILLRLEPKIAA